MRFRTRVAWGRFRTRAALSTRCEWCVHWERSGSEKDFQSCANRALAASNPGALSQPDLSLPRLAGASAEELKTNESCQAPPAFRIRHEYLMEGGCAERGRGAREPGIEGVSHRRYIAGIPHHNIIKDPWCCSNR